MDVLSELNSVSCVQYNLRKKFLKFDDLKKGEILKIVNLEAHELNDNGDIIPIYKINVTGNREGSMFLPGRFKETLKSIEKKGKLNDFNDTFLIYNTKKDLQHVFGFAKTFYEAKLMRLEKFKITEIYDKEEECYEDNISEPGECLPPKRRKTALKKKKKNEFSDTSEEDCIMLSGSSQSLQCGQKITSSELDRLPPYSKQHIMEFLNEN